MKDKRLFQVGSVLKTGELLGIFSGGVKRGKIRLFSYAILSIFVILLLAFYVVTESGPEVFISGGIEYNLLLPVLVLSFILALGGAIAYNPKTWNMLPVIYENGISTSFSPFLAFSDIDEIGYGFQVDGGRFIELFSRKRPWKKCPLVREREYANDFFVFLIEILKKKCPDVPWKKYQSKELIKNGWNYDPTLRARGPDPTWENYHDAKLETVRERLKKEREKEREANMEYTGSELITAIIAIFMILSALIRALFNKDGANIVLVPLFVGIGLFLIYRIYRRRS